MTISSVSAIGTNASTPISVAANRADAAKDEPAIDPVTMQPLPARFPWISRLSQALEKAAVERAAFRSAPVLGDLVNEKA